MANMVSCVIMMCEMRFESSNVKKTWYLVSRVLYVYSAGYYRTNSQNFYGKTKFFFEYTLTLLRCPNLVLSKLA